MLSRNGAIAVASVEYLADAAPVYNLEIAGEHVYEITDLALLVHNANWDCGKFLELQSKVVAKGRSALNAADGKLYDELLDMVKNQFREQLGAAAIKKLAEAAPKELLEAGGHLHHILPKLGRLKHRDRILALQKLLWDDGKGIDPFMSLSIFVYAPNRGVHTDDAIEFIVSQLDTFLKTKRTKGQMIEKLKELGEKARKGKLGT